MCPRQFCPYCGFELIHRDHRRGYESASSLGQILHREGPRQLTCGDIDLYVVKLMRRRGACDLCLLRILEHKQMGQPLGMMQGKALRAIEQLFAVGLADPALNLHPDSGLFLVRGGIEGEQDGKRKVNYTGPQIITRINGDTVFAPSTRTEFYDWLNGGPGWTSREGRGRYGGNE
jgi:hypothetical protein